MGQFLLAILFFASSTVMAGYKGTINFSAEEVASHKMKIHELVETAALCLQDYRSEHIAAYQNSCRIVQSQKVCVSKFYGERRYSKRRGQFRPDGTPLTYLGDALKAVGFPESFMNQMESTSCVGMAMDCLQQAFYKTDQAVVWDRLEDFTDLNGVGGLALQYGLAKLGWKTYYWNPAEDETRIADMQRWDQEELNWQSKGHHSYRYNRVMSRGTYWFNTVDNATDLVGFGRSEPQRLQSVPFWLGTAHTGYHVFPGSFGDVVEAHSTRKITALDNLEFSRFSPFATGGGPRWTSTEKYRSGLIVLPPTF